MKVSIGNFPGLSCFGNGFYEPERVKLATEEQDAFSIDKDGMLIPSDLDINESTFHKKSGQCLSQGGLTIS